MALRPKASMTDITHTLAFLQAILVLKENHTASSHEVIAMLSVHCLH